MASFMDRFTKKVIACPSCGQRSRVPIKPGKALRVTCPGCQVQFEIQFEDPKQALKMGFGQLFSGKGVGGARASGLQRFRPYLIGLAVLLLMKTCFVAPPSEGRGVVESPGELVERRGYQEEAAPTIEL